MQRCQAKEEAIADLKQMMKVTQRVVGTGQAITNRRDWCVSLDIFIVVDIDIGKPLFGESRRGVSVKCIEPPMTGIPSGHGTVKHIVTKLFADSNIIWVTDTQRVHRELVGDQFSGIGDDLGQQISLFVEWPATIAEAIKADLQQSFSTALA